MTEESIANMKKLHISQVDTIFANGSYPIEFLLYFKNHIKTENIRSALKKLSSAFWPIFGEYAAGIIHFEKYEEKACFDEEIIQQEFNFGETSRDTYKRYHKLIPPDHKKLFFIKIIQSKNGTIIIPKLNHLAGDGYSYFYFLSVLAELSRDHSVPFRRQIIRVLYKPHHHRTILRAFQFNGMAPEPLIQPEEPTLMVEKIPRESVREMIKSIGSNLNKPVSPNDILSAMVLKKSVEIQTEHIGDDFQLTIPIDVRNQIGAYGSKYFGNGLMFNIINFNKSDVGQSEVNQIAIRIRKSMPTVSTDNYLDYLKSIETIITRRQMDRLRPYDPEKGCLVTNLSKLPVTRLNFGTGNPDFIFPLTVGKNAAAVLADKANFILRLVY